MITINDILIEKIHTIASKKLFSILIIFGVICQVSCRKLVESPLPTDIVAETNVFSIDASGIAVLNGLYISLNSQPIQGNRSISLLAGLSADEFKLFGGITSGFYLPYYRNALSVLNTTGIGSENWAPLYNYIFKCNAAIEGLNNSNNLTLTVRRQLLGEARFLRAFYYFYLVNLYGDVPLVVITDSDENTLVERSSKVNVYEQIIDDLKQAEELLSDKFLSGTLLSTTTERVRPTKWAALALLARVYLYTKNWAGAEEKSTEVINNTALFSLLPLNNVFLKNSKEAIWQIQPTAINFNTTEAQTLVLPITGPNNNTNPVYLSDQLLNSFESGDLRAKPKNWIDTIRVGGAFYNFPFKYKLNLTDPSITSATGSVNMKEYFMMLRLGEQFLIRAEARAELNKVEGSQSDLNSIRTRAGLSITTAGDQIALRSAIIRERQAELFTEWGHRWLDLKRTGEIDAVMNIVTPQKANGASWQSYQQLYPISLLELQQGPNLTQTPGY